MSSYRRLRHLFQGITSLTVASAAAACGGGAEPGAAIDRSAYTLNVCDGDAYAPLAAVTPGRPTDYFDYRIDSDEFSSTPAQTSVRVDASEGVACKTATLESDCKSKLTAVASTVGWTEPYTTFHEFRYLAYTRGDSVDTVTSLDALSTFLAPIENAKDAAFLASQRGHRFNCAEPQARATALGFELITETGYTCGAGTHTDANVVSVSSAGVVTITKTVRIADGDPKCAVGRRPNGFELVGCDAPSPLGAYFGTVAELEAASVYAFEDLARDLATHGAPELLVANARDAAWDEVRHARMTMKLAQRFGATVRAPVIEGANGDSRSLFDIAVENATEGCVRETFGALQATYQAQHAMDPAIARTMRVIAEDETRHAALAWDVAAWIMPRLTGDERARVDAARGDAVARLEADLTTPIDADVSRTAGVPADAQSAWLLGQVREVLWS